MSSKIIIKNAHLVNEGSIVVSDVLIDNERIAKIGTDLSDTDAQVIDATGKYLIPGLIDDQVHFREPGLTHKAEIYTEAKAAVAGGITSFMEMPNTNPQTVTIELLEAKNQLGAEKSLANYGFFMGATNENWEELEKVDPTNTPGVKVFMGSSTGNMLVDNEEVLERIFSRVHIPIALHCEEESVIRENSAKYKEQYGEEVPISCHPEIRNEEACYLSSSKAVRLAKKHNARIHVLHISTARETELFDNSIPLKDKRITAEACVHHLWFEQGDYAEKGTHIKWNPAVKTAQDREGILAAVLDDRIDVLATDHAPHTLEEKSNTYFKAPSGGPLVQHYLTALLEMHKQGKISLEKIVEKACHNPAICFQVEDRGYIREGYFADLVLVDMNKAWTVDRSNVLSKCGWSPFEGQTFQSSVEKTFVNGRMVYNEGEFDESVKGKRLTYTRG